MGNKDVKKLPSLEEAIMRVVRVPRAYETQVKAIVGTVRSNPGAVLALFDTADLEAELLRRRGADA